MKNTKRMFYVVPQRTIDFMVGAYSTSYTKDDIVDMLNRIRDNMISDDFEYVDSDGKQTTVPDYIKKVFGPGRTGSYYSMIKDRLMEALAYFKGDDRNSLLLGKNLKSDEDKLLRMTAGRGAVSVPEVWKVMGSGAVEIETSYWWRAKVKLRKDIKDFRIFISESRRSLNVQPKDVYVRAPLRGTKDVIRTVYPPEPTVQDPNPDRSDSIVTVNRMKAVGHLISVALAMLEAGTISPGVTKLMSKADQKKAMKMVSPDPVSEAVVKSLQSCQGGADVMPMESVALLGFLFDDQSGYSNILEKNVRSDDPADIVRNIVAYLYDQYQDHSQITQMMLPQIEGLTPAQIRYFMTKATAECLFNSIKNLSDKEWTPVDNIVRDAYRRLFIKDSELLFTKMEYWPRLSYAASDGTKADVTPGNVVGAMTFPLVRGYVYFLTALGVLETTVDLNDCGCDGNPFKRLKYTRLTPLGLYALDKGPHVDLTVDTNYVHNYELIDSPLIVVALDVDNPYNSWLNRIGRPTGNRWVVTPGSFLSNCHSKTDIERTVRDFRKYICDKPSPTWESLFETLGNNAANGSMSVDKMNYTVYDVNPENTELQRFLATDAEMRQMVIRAEGYRILVPREKNETFKQLLKGAGYLI